MLIESHRYSGSIHVGSDDLECWVTLKGDARGQIFQANLLNNVVPFDVERPDSAG